MTLQNKIMRRIYYVYALRAVLQPGVLHGFLMLALLIALTYFVSLGNVIQNMRGLEFGQMDTFLYNAVTNTEAWTILIIGMLIFLVFSLRFTIVPMKRVANFAKI